MNTTIAVGSNNILPFLARVFMGAIFLVAGTRKVLTIAGTTAYMAKLGFPAPELMTYLAIAIEIGGALLLIIGWRTRWVAWLLALFVLVAAFAAHRFWEYDQSQMNNQLNHFLKNFAIIGGFLMIATFGPGRASVDKG